jgi:hypothetical protein
MPTNGPSRSAVESWRLIQIPRKNGKRMKTEKIAKWGRMKRYGVIGLSPMRRRRSLPDPHASLESSPPRSRRGGATAMELIVTVLF